MAKAANNFFKMEMILLKVLEKQDCYGYQITQIIKKASNNNISLAEGTMYPILYRLLDALTIAYIPFAAIMNVAKLRTPTDISKLSPEMAFIITLLA